MKPAIRKNDRYGLLVAVSPTGRTVKHSAEWIWQCDCGNTCISTAETVKWGGKTSCGCVARATKSAQAKTMIATRDEEYVKLRKYQSPRTCSASGTKGVSWHKGRQKWQVRIQYDRRTQSLGYYDDINEAISVRKQAEKEVIAMIEAKRRNNDD